MKRNLQAIPQTCGCCLENKCFPKTQFSFRLNPVFLYDIFVFCCIHFTLYHHKLSGQAAEKHPRNTMLHGWDDVWCCDCAKQRLVWWAKRSILVSSDHKIFFHFVSEAHVSFVFAIKLWLAKELGNLMSCRWLLCGLLLWTLSFRGYNCAIFLWLTQLRNIQCVRNLCPS